MKFLLPDDEKAQAVVIAFLRSTKLSTEEIVSVTGLSATTINRRLKCAEEIGFLKPFVFSPPADMIEKYGSYFQREIKKENKIQKRAGEDILRSVMVVPSKEKDKAANRMRVGKLAALSLIQKIKSIPKGKDLKIGVSWGRTLRALANSLSELKSTEGAFSVGSGKDEKLEFLPLVGAFWIADEEENYPRYSSERIAVDLSECFNERQIIATREIAAPAYIHEDFQIEKKEIQAIRRFLSYNPPLKRIYGNEIKNVADNDPDALVNKLDGIITSACGFPEDKSPLSKNIDHSPTTMLFTQHVKQSMEELLIDGTAVGDICGYILTKSGESSNELVDRINDLFLGPKTQNLLKCADGARGRDKENNIGVVVVASGTEKAEVVHTIIRRGYANEIIIDSELADKLMELYGC